MMPKLILHYWRGAVLPLVLIISAEIAMRLNNVQSDALALPSAIAKALWVALGDGSALHATMQTLAAAMGGMALGSTTGLLTGVILGLSTGAARASALSIELMRPVPSVALIPLSMLVFGFGFRMEIAVVAFTCFWPMLLLSQSAIRQVEPRLLEVAQVLGLSWTARIWKIFIPAAAARLFVALRLSIGIALVVAVTVEIAANPQGLGYALMAAQQSLQPDLMFAMLFWIGLIGWLISAVLSVMQHYWFKQFSSS